MMPMQGFIWQDCDECGGVGTFAYDVCRACMGEGGRWIPAPEPLVNNEDADSPADTDTTPPMSH